MSVSLSGPPNALLACKVPTGAGCVITQPPPVLYQTEMKDGKQDTSSPCFFALQLPLDVHTAVLARIRSGHTLSSLLHGGIRRFDGSELMVYSEEEDTLMGLRLPQKSFEFALAQAQSTPVVNVRVHRKELPVSKSFGGSPFVFVVALCVDSHHQVFVTSKFTIHSKETPAGLVKRSVKKGTRGPPPCKPFPSPPTGPEAFINTALLSLPQPSPHITHMLKEQSLKRGREGDDDGQETRTRSGRSVLVAPGLPRLVTVDEEEKEWEFSKFDLEDLEAGLWPLSGGAPSVDDPLDPDYDPASFEAALSGYPLSPLPPPPPKRAPPALPSLTHSGDTGGPSADLEPDFAALLSGLI